MIDLSTADDHQSIPCACEGTRSVVVCRIRCRLAGRLRVLPSGCAGYGTHHVRKGDGARAYAVVVDVLVGVVAQRRSFYNGSPYGACTTGRNARTRYANGAPGYDVCSIVRERARREVLSNSKRPLRRRGVDEGCLQRPLQVVFKAAAIDGGVDYLDGGRDRETF